MVVFAPKVTCTVGIASDIVHDSKFLCSHVSLEANSDPERQARCRMQLESHLDECSNGPTEGPAVLVLFVLNVHNEDPT